MRAAGATAEQLQTYRARINEQIEQNAIDVFPENWHALSVFLRMGDQWRVVAGFNGMRYLGLDYAALTPVLEECRRVKPHQPMPRLMNQLRTLARTARRILNED